MFTVTTLIIAVSMLILMVRLFAGPTLYDRVLALNTFGSCTVLMIGILGFLFGRPEFLDIALLYALINFVGTIAVLKFFRYRRLGDAPEPHIDGSDAGYSSAYPSDSGKGTGK